MRPLRTRLSLFALLFRFLRYRSSSRIIFVHRAFWPRDGDMLDGLQGFLDHFFRDGILVAAEFLEYQILSGYAPLFLDADAHPPEVLGLERAHDRLNPFMSSRVPPERKLGRAEQYIYVVMEKDDVVRFYFIEARGGSHGVPTFIHECFGEYDDDLLRSDFPLGNEGLELWRVGGPGKVKFLYRGKQRRPADIVAGVFVLIPGVAESDEEIHTSVLYPSRRS